MFKMPPRASSGRARSRNNVAFWIFIVVALIAGAVMYQAATTRGPSDVNYRSSYVPAQTTPAPTSPTTPGPGTKAKVAILGDPYSGGPGVGGNGAANWTELLAQSLSAAGRPIQLGVSTQNSAGYLKPAGGSGIALAQQIGQTVTPDDRVVLVFPSPTDAEQPRDAVRTAASSAYTQIKATAPKAELVVIGQSWTGDKPPSTVTGLRDTLRTAATTAGATFVDPLAGKWFIDDNGKLVGSDGVHLTDQGHKYLADQLQPRVAAALS